MTNPKISIIVPVYNVQLYLRRCVDSLINQTFEDIEIILVNDGSTDHSPEICDEYARTDKRVKVIHKINGGLSDARNVGLVESRGDYVLFVDSDDYINHDSCEVLYRYGNMSNLDIVVGDAVRIESDSQTILARSEVSLNKVMKGTDFLKEQLENHYMHMASCFNLYNRKFLIDNELFFKKGIYHEDEQWTPRVLLRANRVQYIKLAFYNYIIRDNSITKKRDKSKNALDLINTCYELERIYEKIEDVKLKRLLYDYLSMLFLNAIHLGRLYDKKYSSYYDKKFLIGKPKSLRNRLKVCLFIFSKSIYKYVHDVQDHYRNSIG